jgi:large conductance mechanosensitive channel
MYGMAKEFLAFLKNYGVIGLAIAVIIGGKANAMVDAVVKELLMPLVGLLLPSGDWRNLAITVGETKFGIGPVLAALIDFLIVALIVFIVAKKIFKEEVVTKK